MSSPAEAGAPRDIRSGAISAAPSVLVFDVNETLIDIDAMTPLFEQIFADPRALRVWFGQLVMYSMTATLSGNYVDYFTLGQGLLRMLAEVHRVDITDEDLRRVTEGMLTMPAHPDVEDGLTKLRDNGFRLVTLTNSPPNPHGPTPLSTPGWAGSLSGSSASIPTASINPLRRSIATCAENSRSRPQNA